MFEVWLAPAVRATGIGPADLMSANVETELRDFLHDHGMNDHAAVLERIHSTDILLLASAKPRASEHLRQIFASEAAEALRGNESTIG